MSLINKTKIITKNCLCSKGRGAGHPALKQQQSCGSRTYFSVEEKGLEINLRGIKKAASFP